jgi:hypothetical protein
LDNISFFLLKISTNSVKSLPLDDSPRLWNPLLKYPVFIFSAELRFAPFPNIFGQVVDAVPPLFSIKLCPNPFVFELLKPTDIILAHAELV